MEASILKATKQALNLNPEYTPFDNEILFHINSTLSTLNQIGVGPEDGFFIEGPDEKWTDFLTDPVLLNMVRTYIFLKVRYMFDPPQTSFYLNAMGEQIEEHEVRIKIKNETAA